ncbi:MAG: HD domain-containing protein [Nanoarchaeota archaeon]
MSTLDEQLTTAFEELRVTKGKQDSLYHYLSILREKDEATYTHSVRVGLLGRDIAAFMHLDQKALLYAGLLHDIGKALIDPAILKKTSGFNEGDMAAMRTHPELSYKLLRGVFDYSAEIALRHHQFQEKGYPKHIPRSRVFSTLSSTAMINFYARLLSLADFYDAASTRKNNKFGEPKQLTEEEVKEILLAAHPDQKALIGELYTAGIFGNNRLPLS